MTMAYDLPSQASTGQDASFAAPDSVQEQYDTIFYLVRQTTGARHVTIQFDGAPTHPAPEGLACIQAPLVHQGRRIGILRAYAHEFESGAAHMLAGFAVLAAEHHALWSVAHCDMLTRALTRRAFMVDLGRAVATWSRSGVACSLIVFDLDHFKKVNDTYGHAAGDAVLRAVAHVVQSELRPCDRLGRLGGEEFGVILLADVEAAMEIAERLRAVIEGTIVRDFPSIDFTASLGVASCSAQTDTRDSLMSAADEFLYQAKEAGRNRVMGPVHAAACELWD
ncbi:GGDEF domain-containing protein [Roseinatronobacter bogoriensis]|uniref:diguanylate cyclase n=2 Tax=Roseinatronobacter bogoriensis TaxID=119542 RepID=A0A2K8KB40_9RHOB|nr:MULTISPECIES: GGDEF domain-containing protein [Rhodobaca]ATX66647.1 GGDEF domain-containing protein [Rhodobaca barguzinensis]MBB4207827.1 diguanylate cyclase (GGDEF)-like protein [Rhodobaca bogoriensis DSM 18756]